MIRQRDRFLEAQRFEKMVQQVDIQLRLFDNRCEVHMGL
jgi:hypothetical protein